MNERRFAVAAGGCYLAGGAALVGSAFMHWVARGPGSGLRGHRLIDAIVALGKHVPALSAGRLTIVWYLIPALGAASWIAFGLDHAHARGRSARIVAIAALVMSGLAFIAFRQLVGTARLGWGPKIALLGAVALCLGAWAPRLSLPARRLVMRNNDAAGL